MNSTALRPDEIAQIRRVLELTDSVELLPHFSHKPGAVESAMRTAIESFCAVRLHRPTHLDRLIENFEIATAVGFQVVMLESRRSRKPLKEFGGVGQYFLLSKTGSKTSSRLELWARAMEELEAFNTKTAGEFTLALATAFRTHARASSEAVDECNDKESIIDAPPPGEMLNVVAAGQRLVVSRPTVYDWLKKGRLIGWKRGSKQGWVIPAEQIVGPERIVDGIDEVLKEIGDAELAWDFLSNPWPFTGNLARPIEKLIEGDDSARQVVDAASGYLINMG